MVLQPLILKIGGRTQTMKDMSQIVKLLTGFGKQCKPIVKKDSEICFTIALVL